MSELDRVLHNQELERRAGRTGWRWEQQYREEIKEAIRRDKDGY